MLLSSSIVLGSFVSILPVFVPMTESASVPTCNSLTATIYVDSGFIVGGPDNGNVYAGTLNGTSGADVIVGTSGNDIIHGVGNDDDTICGDDGDDTIDTGAGDDWIDAGEGNNGVSAGNGNNTIAAGSGNDTVTGGGHVDHINVGEGNNIVNAGNGSNTIIAGDGNNTINGGGNDDTITAGNGNNTIDAGNGSNVITAGDGDNSVTGGGNADTITVGNGDNVITAGNGDNIIIAGHGDNTITGGGNADNVTTGNGNNIIYVYNGSNTVVTGDGNDVINGGSNTDNITSGGGNDVIVVGNGSNIINAGPGNDSVTTGANNDHIDGGNGIDYCNAGGGTNTVINCEYAGAVGAIVIQKDAVPDDAQDFVFTGDLGSFSLDDDADGTLPNQEVQSQSAGSYDVIESGVTGWALTSITCFDVDGGTSVSLGARTASIDLDEGEVVTCVFENTQVVASSSSSFVSSASSSAVSSSSSSSSAAYSCEDNMALYYKFDEGSGSTVLDAVGSNDGTVFGSTWTASVPAALPFTNPYSMYFDGGDYVDAGDIVDLTTDFSVSAWVNPDSLGTDRQIISRGYDGTNTQWELKTTTAGGNVSFQSWQSGIVGVESIGVPPAGQWTHVVGTYDGTTWRIYLDGSLDNSAVAAGPVHTNRTVVVGAVDTPTGFRQNWEGSLDDVRVYDRTISDSEIADLYAGLCDAPPTCAGQLATVYVNASNLIVGGPDNGNAYLGTLNGTGGDDVIVGTSGNDTINAANGDDLVCADAGNDTVNGDTGDDTVYGGDGKDSLNGDDGNDTLYGENGKDTIKGHAGDDKIFGGNGSDTLQGWQGNDEICAGNGNDDIGGGLGDDKIDGGNGNDTVDGKDGTDICRNTETTSNCEDTISAITLCGVAAGPCTPGDTSLLAYWKFDEGSGSSAADETGNGNDGLLTGGADWSTDMAPVTFENPGSTSLLGTGDRVDAGAFDSLEGLSAFTISLWIKQDTNHQASFVQKNRNDGVQIQPWDNGALYFSVNGQPPRAVSGVSAYPLSTWYHVVGTYDGSTLHIYVDGTEVASQAKSTVVPADAEHLILGGSDVSDFNGLLDDIRIYSRALNVSEVSELASGLCEDSGAVLPVSSSSSSYVSSSSSAGTGSSVSSVSSSSSSSCNCTVGDLWIIGDIEANQTDNPADKFNWQGDLNVKPAFADPFLVGTTPTNEFPWGSYFTPTYASDFDVEFDYAGSDCTAQLTLGWAPGASGSETKVILLDGTQVGTVTRQGAGASGWWMNFPRFEDTFSFSLSNGHHALSLQQTNGNGTIWDYVKLEVIDCSASCGSSSSSTTSVSSSTSSASSQSSFVSSSNSSVSSAGGGLSFTSGTKKGGISDTGQHRGSMTTQIAGSLNVSLALLRGGRPGQGFALAPGGFGGGPAIFGVSDVPPPAYGGGPVTLTEEQKILLCKAQKILTQHVDRLPARAWVAAMLSSVLNLSKPVIFEALDDPSICNGLNLSRASDYGIY